MSTRSKYIVDYGDDAAIIFVEHGDTAYNAVNKCSGIYKADAVKMINEEGGTAARYLNRKTDEGVKRVLDGNYGKYETKPLPDNFRDTCINKDLAGKTHPETGVPFEERTVTLGGKESKVVVPKFESNFDAQLPDDMLRVTDDKQFRECNEQLKEALSKNPELKSKFSDKQLTQIKDGVTPDGFTWHHDAETGRLQLVDTVIHNKTNHTGGRAIWGGGSDHR